MADPIVQGTPANSSIARRHSSLSTSGELQHPALQDLAPSTKYLFYTPHTITGLVIGEFWGLKNCSKLLMGCSASSLVQGLPPWCTSAKPCTQSQARDGTLHPQTTTCAAAC